MEKERYKPHIGGVMVSRHDMVSLQNRDTWGGPPLPIRPSDATAQIFPDQSKQELRIFE